MSSTCPPIMPAGPGGDGELRTMRGADRGAASVASTSNAIVTIASPARMAIASPKTLWLVGRPRRRSSSSIAGRSSWTRLKV